MSCTLPKFTLIPERPVTKITVSQGLVSVFAVVDLGVDQNTETGGSDHTVEQEGDSADDRSRDRLDQGR